MSALMNSRILTGVLLSGCAALGLLALDVLDLNRRTPGAEAVARLGNPATGAAANESRVVRPLPELEAFSETLERPLFNTDRRPVVPDAKDVSVVPAPRLSVLLSGIVITEGGRFAHLRSETDARVRVLSEGDALDNWRVESILPDRVVLRAGDRRHELILKDKQKPPKKAKPNRRGARKRTSLPERRVRPLNRARPPQGRQK